MDGGTLVAPLALSPVVVYVHFDSDGQVPTSGLCYSHYSHYPIESREPSDMAESPILSLAYKGQLSLSFSKMLPLTSIFLIAW